MQSAGPEPAPTTPPPLQPYAKREFRFEGLLEAGDFRIKMYSIGLGDSEIPEHVIETAMSFVIHELPTAADAEGSHHGVGFAVVHAGEQATWLLLHWWAHARPLSAPGHGAPRAGH